MPNRIIPPVVSAAETDSLSEYIEYEESQYTSCPNIRSYLKFVNTTTGVVIPVPCNSYSCPYCGKFKARRLYNALYSYFKQFKIIRFWTFTISSDIGCTKKEHYKIFTEVWRRFINEIRRNVLFSKKQKNFQYVRVAEPHKSGYIHFHAIFTEYFPRDVLQKLWDNLCKRLTGREKHTGTCIVKGIISTKNACRYISKYVLKSVNYLFKHSKKWTKSGKTGIFPKKAKNGEWTILTIGRDRNLHNNEFKPFWYLLYNTNCTTSQKSDDFLGPPNPNIDLFAENYADYIEMIREDGLEIVNISSNIEIRNFNEVMEYFSFDIK